MPEVIPLYGPNYPILRNPGPIAQEALPQVLAQVTPDPPGHWDQQV